MSFLAKLSIDGGEEMNVLNCDFRFNQMTNATGKVTSVPSGGYVDFTIESTKETVVFDWMISPTSKKNGKVTFYRRDVMSKLQSLDFEEAYCVAYHQSYTHQGEHPMQVSFTVSAKKLKLNDSEFINNRPDQD
jgi:hypothetical protein